MFHFIVTDRKTDFLLPPSVEDWLGEDHLADFDSASVPDGMNLPQEIKLRKNRLEAMAVAKIKIAARAAQHYAKEKAEFDAKMVKRAAKEQETNNKPRGKVPTPPEAGVRERQHHALDRGGP